MSTSALPPGDHTLTITSSADGAEQSYRLYVPSAAKDQTPLPLLVVLHGRGVDRNAWFDLTPIREVAERYGYLVAAPNGRGDSCYDGPGEQDVLDIIKQVKRDFPVDPDRVYLTGHSMGGWGTWYIGLRHPDIFGSICPMAGMAPLELMPNARYLAPFILHDTDDDVVSVEQSRRPARRLAELGISFQYLEKQGYGHGSNLIGAVLPRVFDWFERHRRVNQPERVTFVVQPGEGGQAYWIHIPPTAAWLPTPFAVDARVVQPDRLSIKTEHLIQLVVALAEVPLRKGGSFTVEIDGQTISLGKRTDWVVFTRSLSERKWSCELRESWPAASGPADSPKMSD